MSVWFLGSSRRLNVFLTNSGCPDSLPASIQRKNAIRLSTDSREDGDYSNPAGLGQIKYQVMKRSLGKIGGNGGQVKYKFRVW
jgi:hypothetical protein